MSLFDLGSLTDDAHADHGYTVRAGPRDWTLHVGDSREMLRLLPDASVDSCVCDPPYELWSSESAGRGFMGKAWDGTGIAHDVGLWREVLRVLKPGGHLLAFGGTRTHHRMACAIEDAGFQIRDMMAWAYSTGFPKSLDVSKAIDKKANEIPVFDAIRAHLREWRDRKGYDNKALNEVAGSSTSGGGMARHWTSEEGGQHAIPSKDQWRKLKGLLGWPDCEFDAVYDAVKDGANRPVIGRGTSDALAFYAERQPVEDYEITAPATDAARQWSGWGTALKPAMEPVCVARKPLSGTVAGNVIAHGTGALNVDACRVGEAPPSVPQPVFNSPTGRTYGMRTGEGRNGEMSQAFGRWPANILHDGSADAVAAFGDAARFFYCAKTSTWERNAGCTHLPARTGAEAVDREEGSAGVDNPRAGAGRKAQAVHNFHPTVKPVDLMRYLVTLVTPVGGLVLDPFAGSGSTGCGAMLAGCRFHGIELDTAHAVIAHARITWWERHARHHAASAHGVIR